MGVQGERRLRLLLGLTQGSSGPSAPPGSLPTQLTPGTSRSSPRTRPCPTRGRRLCGDSHPPAALLLLFHSVTFPRPFRRWAPQGEGRPPVLPAGPSPASSLLLCCLQSWESAPSGRGSGRVSVPMRRAPDLCLRPTPLLKLSCKGMTDLRQVLFSPSADS